MVLSSMLNFNSTTGEQSNRSDDFTPIWIKWPKEDTASKKPKEVCSILTVDPSVLHTHTMGL